MRRLYLAMILLIGTLLVGAPPVPAHAAHAAADIPGGQGMPLALRADGGYVAWAELVQPNRFVRYANLHVASLADGQPVLELGQLPISSYAGPFGASFALGDGVLVWRDGAEGQPQSPLKALDLASGESWVLAPNGGVYPAIAGGNVSWWELSARGGAPATAVLMLRPLRADAAPAELLRAELAHDYDLRGSRMSAGWLAWAQAGAQSAGQPVCPTLYVVSLSSDAQQAINDVACHDDQQVQFDLYGDRLAYVDRNNLLAEREPPTIERGRSGPHANLDLALAERYVFWNHAAAPGPWGFDPQTGSTFQVGSSGLLAAPAVGGGVLAWAEANPAGGYTLRVRPIASLLPSAPRAANAATAGQAFFPETGHTLGGEFLAFWKRNGGLPVFGYALTEELQQQNSGLSYVVQYFERQRFELHPENTGTPYSVLLGRLGAEALAAQGRDWQVLPKASPAAAHYFAATGQAVAPEFWEYWRVHGLELGDRGVSEREALALWGYPLTPAAYEPLPNGETLLVQWFERARFEYHPNNPAPFRVLLGRLAADRVEGFGWR